MCYGPSLLRPTPSAAVVVDAKLVQNPPDINQNNVIVISKPTEVKTSVQKKVATAVTAVRAQESTAQQVRPLTKILLQH